MENFNSADVVKDVKKRIMNSYKLVYYGGIGISIYFSIVFVYTGLERSSSDYLSTEYSYRSRRSMAFWANIKQAHSALPLLWVYIVLFIIGFIIVFILIKKKVPVPFPIQEKDCGVFYCVSKVGSKVYDKVLIFHEDSYSYYDVNSGTYTEQVNYSELFAIKITSIAYGGLWGLARSSDVEGYAYKFNKTIVSVKPDYYIYIFKTDGSVVRYISPFADKKTIKFSSNEKLAKLIDTDNENLRSVFKESKTKSRLMHGCIFWIGMAIPAIIAVIVRANFR